MQQSNAATGMQPNLTCFKIYFMGPLLGHMLAFSDCLFVNQGKKIS
jgi:hypothetical protein